MKPNNMPTQRRTAAEIAQDEVNTAEHSLRSYAKSVGIVLAKDGSCSRVTVDGVDLNLPPTARVRQELRPGKNRPLVTITVQAKNIQIMPQSLDLTGVDE